MPVYTYRREDGSTFDIRQSFSDPALTNDPSTGQRVSRVVQNTGVIFKGSGFYKNDNKNSSKSAAATTASKESKDGESAKSPETKSTETAATAPAPAATPTASAAD